MSFPSRQECVLRDLLLERAGVSDVFAVFEDGEEWTFAETAARAWGCGRGLQELGLAQGDSVVGWLPNGRDALVAWFGAAATGLVYTPLNTAYKGALLENALNLLRARVLVVHPSLVDRLRGLELPHLERVLVAGSEAGGLLERHASEPPELGRPVEPWDDQMVMFTGGTTGASKAVRRPYVLYQKMCEACFDSVGVDGSDRFLVCAPMFHGGADVPIYSMLRNGGSVAIVSGFSTSGFWDDVRRYRCTVAWIHSAMAQFLWEQDEQSAERDHPLRLAMQAPLLPTHREFAARFGVRLYTVYGMTEIPCPFSILDPVDHRTLGKPWHPDIEVRLVDAHDREVLDGTPGELCVRHRVPWAITPGYFNDARATADAWRNGWFHSGDLFIRDGDANYSLVGRVKDSLRRRGENISAAEVERELVAHDDVFEAAVVGVQTAIEEEVMAFLVARPGREFRLENLVAFVTDRLPYYAVPRYLELVDELPRTASLRVDKEVLRNRGVSTATWDRERAGIRLRRERL